jgi:hypothetical protein
MPISSVKVPSAIADFIREMETALPPEKRSAGAFLGLAETVRGNITSLESEIRSIVKERFGLDDMLFTAGPYGKILFGLYIQPQLASGLKSIYSMIESSLEYLDDVIPVLQAAADVDPNAPPPEEAWPLFYKFPNDKAGGVMTPVYIVPLLVANQAEALLGSLGQTMSSMWELLVESAENLAENVAEGAAVVLREASEAAGRLINAAASGLVSGLGLGNVGILLAFTALGVGAYYLTNSKKAKK